MDMNFPHADLANKTPMLQKDHRAFLARAIARQASSPTARALVLSKTSGNSRRLTPAQMLRERMVYFANYAEQISGGSFLPAGCIKLAREDEGGVYQNISVKSKASNLQTTEPGNGSTSEISRTS